MEDAVFEMYRSIKLGQNAICLKCKDTTARGGLWPVSIWNVGPKFHDDRHKILFVGKTAVDDPGKETESGLLDARECAKKYFSGRISNLWNYLNLIAKEIYGTPEEGWEHIAMTNMVKCNQLRGNGAARDTTPWTRKEYCLKELKVLWREIEILRPRKIIFLTSWGFDNYIDSYRVGDRHLDVETRDHTVAMGSKNIPWWHRKFFSGDRICQEFLRTGHPERIQKEAFIQNIVAWIKSDSIDAE